MNTKNKTKTILQDYIDKTHYLFRDQREVELLIEFVLEHTLATRTTTVFQPNSKEKSK